MLAGGFVFSADDIGTIPDMSKDLQQIQKAKGRPMLQWVGKKPLDKIEYYPAQEKEIYGDKNSKDFNKLFWGDNLQVLSNLLKEYRGKIDLIYIDPPFDSKADYIKNVKIRGEKLKGEQYGLLEEKQYTDIWDRDEYLQFMYERLLLIRELLSESGVIYLHSDHRKEHHLRMLLEEVLGDENYLNTISWRSQVPRGRKADAFYYAYSTHYIHIFAKNKSYPPKWCKQIRRQLITKEEAEKDYIHDGGGYFRTSDPGSYTFESLLKVHKENRIYVSMGGRAIFDEKNKSVKTTKGTIGVKYYLKQEGDKYVVERTIDNLWDDIPGLGTTPQQDTGYPTQKTEQLLKRVIEASTDGGDLVADFFVGSGTTPAVAQKLGRRWLACDINLGAIQTTAKRLNQIVQDQKKEQPKLLKDFKGLPAFKIYNVNDYDIFKNELEAKEIVMEMYGVEPIKRSYFDGVLDNNFVKVMPMNRVLNKLDIKTALKNIEDKIGSFTVKQKSKSGEAVYEEGVLVICSGKELDVLDFLRKENKTGVRVEIRDILTDKKNLTFKQKPEAKVEVSAKDKNLSVEIKEFYSPILMRKLEIENEKMLKKDQQAKVGDFRQIIDSVAIDVDYNGELFNAEVMDLPSKKELIKARYSWEYPKVEPPQPQAGLSFSHSRGAPGAGVKSARGEFRKLARQQKGKYTVAVKIVDVLGEEYFETFDVSA